MAVCDLPKVEAPVRFRYPAFRNIISIIYADVAQPVEQCFRKAEVVGSIPTVGLGKTDFREGRFSFS